MILVPTPTVSPTLAELLATFVSHFKRAIRQEMDVMRERKGSFDIALAGGVVGESGEAEGGVHYTYSVLAPDEKLVAGIECTLRTRAAEYLVRVERVDGSDVTVSLAGTPFGAGPRVCPGSRRALALAAGVLAALRGCRLTEAEVSWISSPNLRMPAVLRVTRG